MIRNIMVRNAMIRNFMDRNRVRLILAILFAVCAFRLPAVGQEPAVLQTARQAFIEMMTGGEESFRKHLTLEVQQRLGPAVKNPMSAIGSLGVPIPSPAGGSSDIQSFSSGHVLFSIGNVLQREKIEVQVEKDELRGDSDDIELSFHSFRDSKEENFPIGFHVVLGFKQQVDVWRINAITFSAKIPVGDPNLYDSSYWTPSKTGVLRADSGSCKGSLVFSSGGTSANVNAKLSVARATRLVGMAESIYARKHPEAGFTCNLADLVNIGKGLDDGESFSFLDPEFAGGSYGGYRYTLSGCESKPASAFQVVAEPISGTGRAYCSDATRTLRASDDGHGATCLASGKVTKN